jgi:hypothetical protein
MSDRIETDRNMWFSMWFLASIATFGVAFFPMFYRLIENRNRHFRREADLEKRIIVFVKNQGREPPVKVDGIYEMNARAWTIAVVFVIPVFAIAYFLSKDLIVHEKHQDAFLSGAFQERMFMPQTVPIGKYVLLTIVTMGWGIVYWLYKIINLYNAHFKAQWAIEKEIDTIMEDNKSWQAHVGNAGL